MAEPVRAPALDRRAAWFMNHGAPAGNTFDNPLGWNRFDADLPGGCWQGAFRWTRSGLGFARKLLLHNRPKLDLPNVLGLLVDEVIGERYSVNNDGDVSRS
jgi:hypothetical protein